MGFNFVYWIHLPHHVEEFDGYIGVSNNPNRRLKQHIRSRDNAHLKSFLKKYKDEYTMDIIYTGKKEDCYKLEERLRPNKNIGLNKAKGGSNPPIGSHCGFSHSAETKQTMSVKKMKKVRCIELDVDFDSIKEAKRELGIHLKISEVCNRKRKTTGGMTFEFIEGDK